MWPSKYRVMSSSSASRLTADSRCRWPGRAAGRAVAGARATAGRAWTSRSSGGDRAAGEPGGAAADVLFQPAQVFVLVPERLVRLAAALADPLGELDHLVDRLLAVEPHDVVEHHPPDVVLGLAGPARQGLDEHGHHDLGPSLADQRKRAVEVEQDVADLGARRQGNGQLDAGPAADDLQLASWCGCDSSPVLLAPSGSDSAIADSMRATVPSRPDPARGRHAAGLRPTEQSFRVFDSRASRARLWAGTRRRSSRNLGGGGRRRGRSIRRRSPGTDSRSGRPRGWATCRCRT